MADTEIDLGEMDLSVVYKFGDDRLKCFPIDELNAIDFAAEKSGATEGEPFLEIIKSRLQTHEIASSSRLAWRWYSDMVERLKEQKDFTDGSGDTVVATESGHSPDPSASKKSNSSKPSKKASKPKS